MGKLFVTLFAFLPAGRQGLHRDSFLAPLALGTGTLPGAIVG